MGLLQKVFLLHEDVEDIKLANPDFQAVSANWDPKSKLFQQRLFQTSGEFHGGFQGAFCLARITLTTRYRFRMSKELFAFVGKLDAQLNDTCTTCTVDFGKLTINFL